MSEELQKQLQELRQLRDQGLLSEDTYQAAVTRLQATAAHEADTTSGAVAQGEGATAVASRGVSARDVAGSVVTGDHNVLGNVYYGDPTDDPQEALRIYRQVLLNSSANLPLRGVDVGASDPATAKKLGLANVYIDLDTTSKFIIAADEDGTGVRDRRAAVDSDDMRLAEMKARGEKERPLTALEATIDNRWLILTGDPGGGKSTFVNHLAFCLAGHSLQPDAGWLEHLPGWPQQEAGLLPLVVTLRDFAAKIDETQMSAAKPKELWQFLCEKLDDQNLGFAAKAIEWELRNGRAIVFLDGLDEVPGTKQRRFVRDAVAAFADNYQLNRFLVTCRILSYQPPDDKEEPDLRLDLNDFPIHEIAPFDEAKIDRFIEAWYAELARIGSVPAQDARRLAARLKEAVRRQDLWRLAPNPLLLTVMSLVHAHEGRLPDARALLYERTIDMLLWRWEEVKSSGGRQTPTLRQLLLDAGRADLDLKRLLWRLAYEAHGRSADGDGQEGLGDITQAQLTRALVALKREDWQWAHMMVEAMKLRAGLLLEREPGVFTFPHRTFQEYLAGAYLSTQTDFGPRAADLGAEGALWREAILLAAGRLVHVAGDVEKALAMVNRLCPPQEPGGERGWRNAWLAADALQEIGLQRVLDDAWGRELLARVQERLAQLITQGRLAPRERAAAGITLALIGDSRPEVIDVDRMHFCPVPAGQFWMGSAEDDEKADEDERPLHQVDIPYNYWISQYPVSNAQFTAFVADKGYQGAEFWPEAIADEFWQERKGFKGRWDVDFRNGPVDYGIPFTLDNHPVVGVSWYEALAFTRWLTQCWRANGHLPDHLKVTLPSEAEWEKAARGGLQIPAQAVAAAAGQWGTPAELVDNPQEKRRYPWGDDFDQLLANSSDSGIGRTSALGVFSAQQNPYGAYDMSGNTFEWTRSRFNPYPYKAADGRETIAQFSASTTIVLRGGYFGDDTEWLRCACRYWHRPHLRDYNLGFRLVVSPLLTSEL
jgi:formylglycine-generating enzyme required for sulfatase activity